MPRKSGPTAVEYRSVTDETNETEEEKLSAEEISNLFSFKAAKLPRKENSLREGQVLSVAPSGSDLRQIAVLKKISVDQIWLEFPRPIPESPLKAGDDLRLKFWDYNEATYCDAEILEISGPTGDLMVVSRPSKGEIVQRKRSLAIYDKLLFSLRVTEAAENQLIGQEQVDREARELTLNRLEFRTELPLKANDKLELNLQLPPDQEMATAAKVASSREIEEEGETFCVVSLQFVDMEAEPYNRLALFLALAVHAGSVEDIFWTG